MGRWRFGSVALPIAAVVVLAGATAGQWLPAILHPTPRDLGPETAAPSNVPHEPHAPHVSHEPPRSDLIRFGRPKVIPRPPGTVRLANYNVENLFDDVDDPALSGRYEDKDMTKPEAHLKAMAEALRRLDADIVALQEIESLDALLWFRDRWIPDLGYHHVASIDAGDERGIEQSVLSRYPIARVANWPQKPLNGVHPDNAPDATPGEPLVLHRSPLVVDVIITGNTPDGAPADQTTLTLFVVHHKAGARSAYWREAEAAKVLELAKAEQAAHPGRPIAILGDFNAMPSQASFQTYLTGGFIDLFADRDESDPAWITHESGRVIDGILGNPDFARHVVTETRFIMGMPARPAGVDWRTTPPPDGYASDHYPVVIDLRFQGKTPAPPSPPAHGGERQGRETERHLDVPAGGGR